MTEAIVKQNEEIQILRIVAILVAVMCTSCGDGEASEPVPNPGEVDELVGTWYLETTESDDGTTASLSMKLTFNEDKTGSIVETLTYTTRATESQRYSMNFGWSTTSNSNGEDILRVSYVSGDKNTWLFMGSSSTVLWTRQYVVTGDILNVYLTDGVLVFHRL